MTAKKKEEQPPKGCRITTSHSTAEPHRILSQGGRHALPMSKHEEWCTAFPSSPR